MGSKNSAGDAASIDKVRDLLFGAEVRNIDGRLQRLEERLAREMAAVREDLKSRLDSLEGYVKNELKAVHDTLKSERSERTKADKDLERQLGRLDERTRKNESALRDSILSESRKLADELEQRLGDLNRLLAEETRELRDSKTDRAALGDLLTEVAMRLKGELELPDVE